MYQNSLCSFYVSLALSSLAIVPIHSFADGKHDFQAAKSQLDKAEVIDTIEIVAKSEGGLTLNSRSRVNRNELDVVQASTLGETLSKVSGVQGSSFGPGSNMPTIRSLGGTRVSIVNNHLDVNDVAAISGNLPIAVEPMTVESITVEKTGANILYGGKAIGGAIYIEDNRIPKRLPESGKKFSGSVDVSTGYNTGQKQAFRLDW